MAALRNLGTTADYGVMLKMSVRTSLSYSALTHKTQTDPGDGHPHTDCSSRGGAVFCAGELLRSLRSFSSVKL